jgi:hypothetical protein
MIGGLKVVQVGDVIATCDVYVYGMNPAWARNLRTFGEAGVVKDAKNAKTGNRGTVMMFVGYPDNREHYSVRMLVVKKIATSRSFQSATIFS